MNSALVSLRDELNWDPQALVASSLSWPDPEQQTRPLRDLVSTLLPDSWVDGDVPVITPGALDPVGGGVRRRTRNYRGPVYQVRDSQWGLRPGDLLIPARPDLPALFVRPEHTGSMVSSSFLALRPIQGLGLWIWALLSSHSGKAFRMQLAAGVVGWSTSKSALLDLAIPVPPLAASGDVSNHLVAVEQSTHREEEEARETWWRTTDVSSGEWSMALATPNPDLLAAGVPLSDLCKEIVRGRFRISQPHTKEPIIGNVAVTDIQVLGGGPVRRWISPTVRPLVLTQPGDVCVAAIGARPHAAVSTEITAVDGNVFVLRLRDTNQAPAIVRFLNGQAGYGLRQVLLTGNVLPSLRKDDLARLPVPPDSLIEIDTVAYQAIPLEIRLEQALWN